MLTKDDVMKIVELFFAYRNSEATTSILTITSNVKSFIPIILIVLFIIQAFAFTSTFDVNNEFRHPEEMSKYIVDNDPHYDTVSIGAYNLRPYSWWLGENVVGIVNSNQTAIDESNVTYYISNKQLDKLNNYDEIKNMGNLYLYKKSV